MRNRFIGLDLTTKIEESGLTAMELRLWRPCQLQLKGGWFTALAVQSGSDGWQNFFKVRRDAFDGARRRAPF